MIKVTIDYNPVFDMVPGTVIPVDEIFVDDNEIANFMSGLVKDIDICRIKRLDFEYGCDEEDVSESEG